MKKKFTFLAFLLCLLCGLNTSQIMAQTPILIGDEANATLNMGLPFDIWASKNICQQLFTADEIGYTSGTINSLAIKFRGDGSSATYDRKVAVYINNTDLQALSHSESIPSSQVANFDGTITFAPNEWAEFVFTTPFEYTGGNIIVTMYDYSGYSSGGGTYNFYVNKVSEGRVVFLNGYAGDASNFGDYAAYSSTERNIIKFTIEGGVALPKPQTQTIEIGTQTASSSYLPTYTYYGNSLTQQIYTSTEIGINQNANIKSIAFKDVSGNVTTRSIEIYMRNTDINSCTSSSTVMNNNELCFDGSVTFLANDWSTITLQTPFEYEAGKNVLLCIVDKTEQYPNGRYFAVYNSNESSFYMYRDYNRFYATTDTYTPSGLGGIVDQKNCIKLEYEEVAIPLSITASAEQTTIFNDETVQLTASASGGTGNYTYNWSPATGLDNATIANPIFTPTATGTYTFTCTVNDGATTVNASVTVNVEERPAAPATAPVVTAIADGPNSITLSWNAVDGAEWYDIYVDGVNANNVKDITATQYTFTGLQADSKYCFIINAVNAGGESPDSDQVCIKTDRIKQYRIKAVGHDKYLNIAQITSSNTGGKSGVDVAAYAESDMQIFTIEDAGNSNVYFRSASGYYINCLNGWMVCANGTTTSYAAPLRMVDQGDGTFIILCNDGYFKVEEVSGGLYPFSNGGSNVAAKWTLEEVVVLEPAIPTGLTATPLSDSKILLEWKAAENALSYKVYMGNNLLNSTEETSYLVESLAEETDYCFKIKSVRGTKESDFSYQVCEMTKSGNTAPDEAAVLVATPASGIASIILTWNEVAKATSYNVYDKNGILITKTSETTYTAEGLELDTEYCYTVKAANEFGESLLSSNLACATTYNGIPIIVIGDGTYPNNLTRTPTYVGKNYSYTQQIYTKDEIGLSACEITNIAFYQKTSYTYTRSLEIYLVNTDKESFSGTSDWVSIDKSCKVFDGTYTFGSEWCDFELDYDFSYEGQNILLCVIDKTNDWRSPSMQFAQNSTINGQTLYTSSDNTNYSSSGISGTGSRVFQNNQIKLTFKMLPDGVTPTPEEITFESSIRGGNYWSEKDIYSSVEKVSLKAKNTTITGISLSDDSFFTIPANIDLTADPVEFNIGHKANPTAGTKNANLIVTHSIGTTLVPLSATVYEPATADIFEKAQDVTINVGENTLPDFANLHDDYVLPNEVNDGNNPDVVYSFVLSEDAILDINITGTNAVTALYKGDFNGEGPSNDNNYQLSSTKFFFDFENGDFSGLTLKDGDGDGRNWEIISDGYDGSNYCARSYSYNDGFIYPENYIVTTDKYYITESSVLSFYATSFAQHKDGYTIEYSEDGIEFIEFDSKTAEGYNNFELHEFNLSSLAGKDVYLAINHNTSGQDYLRIDDLRLSDGTDAQSDIYPAGTYYLVAAAEDAFTVNITKTALPAPEAITYTSPANNAMNQANPELCFELGKYTTEYRVLLGLTNPPTTVEKDWTSVTKSDYINSFQTEGLNDNTKYYWKVEARNSSGTTEGAVYSFVTPLNKPTDIVTDKTEMFTSEEAIITWTAAKGASYYNVYASGERVNTEPITKTTYTLSNLARRMDPGYDVTVTAVHALGESAHSDTVNIKVSGECDLIITVVNTVDSILEGAEVSFYGINEFGNRSEYGPFVSDTSGRVSQRVHMLKSGEFYYINVIKAPYTTITDSALIPYDYLLYGNYQFTITMNLPAPANFRAENDKIYEGDDVVLHWDEVVGATSYNIYVDGVKHNAEALTGTTYTISGLAFNQSGYNVTVTAVLPEGESIHSDPVIAKVGGTFTLVINVKDNNDNTLADADVTITLDNDSYEFDAIGNNLPDSLAGTTDANGKASFTMPLFDNEPGHNIYYTVAASKTSYKNSSSLLGHYGYAVEGDAFITNGGVYEFDCTLLLAAPENFKAEKDYYVEGKSARFYWDAIDADNLLGYNFYYSEWNENTYETNYIKLNSEYITNNRYTVEGLEYGQQTYCVTAVYDLGESPMAYAYIQVTGYGSISGTVTDESSNPISGATVMITGKDRFDTDQTYFLTTDANGKYSSNEIMPSTWDPTYQYTATVSKVDYFNGYSSSPISVEYNETTEVPTIVLQAKPSVDITVTATVETDYNDDEYVQIGWSSVGDAESYNVYRKDLSSNNATQLNDYNITWTSHTDNDWMSLPNGDYQYGVSAIVKNYTTESFEGGAIPTGWSLEADFIEEHWTVYDNTSSYIAPRTGSYAIYRNGDVKDNGLANHITMAPIDMTSADNATLSFYYVNVNSPSGGDWVNTLTVSAREYGSDSWNELYSTHDEAESWTEMPLSLDEYAGKIVEVRFSATSFYAQYVAIDDITVTLPSEESKINWSNTLTKQGIEFTGLGNWNVVGNWNTGEIPGESANVSISGDAIINTDVTVRTLTIAEGGSLILQSGTLTVTEGMTNEIASAFIIEDGAQVVQSKDNVKATFNMNIVAPSNWDEEENQEGWQFIASPMKDTKTASFETDGVDFDLLKYEGEKELEWVNYKGHNEDVISGATYLFDFTDGFDGWGVIDANGDGYSWGHNLTDEGHNFQASNLPNDEGYLFNDATWWTGTSNYNAAPDDYLVAPYMMTIGKHSALRLQMGNYNVVPETPEISVLVSEVNKNTEDYVVEDFTTVGIAPIVSACWGAYEEVIIPLDKYIDKEVRIAIRHNAPDSWNSTVILGKVELANIPFETEFKQGRGYLASYETTTKVAFAGVLSNETGHAFNEMKPYNADDYYANFYLLGNPFAFNMDWTNVIAEGLASGYATVTLDGTYEYATDSEIKVGDGFFVKVIDAEPSLSYYSNNGGMGGMRSRRADKKSYLNLVASSKAGSDNVIINFTDNDEEGFDKLENFNKDIAEIYVKEEGKRYGIMNVETDVEEIELYFSVKRMGEYTINAITEGEFQNVILVDKHTGVETDLTTSHYTFKALSSDHPDRFIIRMGNEVKNDNFVYQSGDELIINAEGSVQIIDIMGRIVYSSDIVNETHRVNTSSFDNAAYIVRVLNTNEIKTQKVVIY